jgi:CRP-like cAMP-binding protein
MVTSAELANESLVDAGGLEELRTALQPLELPAGARVFEQGEPGDRMLLIADGQARSSIRLPNGIERALSHAGPGDVVGEIALLTGAHRTATVTAVTPLRGWTLDRHGFDVLRWDASGAAISVVQRLVALTTARLLACCTREMGEPFGDRSVSAVIPLGSIPRQVPRPAVEYLASLVCFVSFPHLEDVSAAVRHAPAYSVERGDILIHPGAPPASLMLVARGAVEVMVRHGSTTRRVRLAGPGRFVGHNGILDEHPSPVMARSRERSVLLAFPRATITAFLTDPARPSRAFSAALLEDAARAVREASRPVASTTARS